LTTTSKPKLPAAELLRTSTSLVFIAIHQTVPSGPYAGERVDNLHAATLRVALLMSDDEFLAM
jgi:hypothetical protein